MEAPISFVQKIINCFNVDRFLGSNFFRAFLVVIALRLFVPQSPQLILFQSALLFLGVAENTYMADSFFALAGYHISRPFPQFTLSRAQLAHDAVVLLVATAIAILPLFRA